MDGAIKDVGRAVGGSLLFASPLLMTMEIWEIAPSMPGTRVVVLLFATCVLLVTLAQLSGFNDLEGQGLADHVVDAGVAIAVGPSSPSCCWPHSARSTPIWASRPSVAR